MREIISEWGLVPGNCHRDLESRKLEKHWKEMASYFRILTAGLMGNY